MEPQHQKSLPDKITDTINTITKGSPKETRDQLFLLVNELISNDFQALVQLLYRVDIDEKKLKKMLKQNEGIDAAEIITDCIIKRELQKIETKKQFGHSEPPDHNDGW